MDEVIAYRVYLATDELGSGRSMVGSDVASNLTSLDLDSNTLVDDFSHIVVYTVSELVEQTTPAFVEVVDKGLTAREAVFQDLDLDATDIGGPLAWNLTGNTSDLTQITHYAIYLGWVDVVYGAASSTTTNITNMSEEESVAPITSTTVTTVTVSTITSTSTSTVPATTVNGSDDSDAPDTSDGTNQSDDDTGNVSESNDSDGSRSNDSETSDSFNASPETPAAQGGALEGEDNESYNDSNDSNGTNFSLQVGATTALPTTVTLTTSLVYVRGRFIEEISAFTGDPPTILTSYLLSPETDLSNFTHLFVYVRTSFADQSTPAAAQITDVEASTSSIQFTDYDLDETQIGGTVSFLPPIDMQFVEALQIKLAYGSPSVSRPSCCLA
ncbi:icmt [Symbiodinium sp. CCMP2592]|nr:icmt [Symbiodinium sp. CCMP2592]